MLFIFVISFVVVWACEESGIRKNDKLLFLTVATNETDGFLRFRHSAKLQGFDVQALGMGKPFSEKRYKGNGFKVNLLREEIEKYKDEKDLIVVFTDSYDLIVVGDQEELLEKFYAFEANIVFGAEYYCWPKPSLLKLYPSLNYHYTFLNSGVIMGYAPVLYQLLSHRDFNNTENDQLYFSEIFIDRHLRFSYNIKLDLRATIVQNLLVLNRILEDVILDFNDEPLRLFNTLYETKPVFIHGLGDSRKNLNFLSNYMLPIWPSEDTIDLDALKKFKLPKVMIGFFCSIPTPFIAEALQKISNLNYPKEKIHLYLFNKVLSHENIFRAWIEDQKDEKFNGIKYISSLNPMEVWQAKTQAANRCVDIDCDIYFNVDGEVQLDNPDVLKLLISYNKSVIAPVMKVAGSMSSTFWGDVTVNDTYLDSEDYADIVNNEILGIWNVPHIHAVYAIKRKILDNVHIRPNYILKANDPDGSFSKYYRKKDVYMYASNLLANYGHLVGQETVTSTNLHNDLWQVAANPYDWENKYLNPLYYRARDSNFENEIAYADVYAFPVFSHQFCKELAETMKAYKERSIGETENPRLSDGHGIRMEQIGYEREWNFILEKYLKPLADKVNPNLDFLVKEKSFPRPHILISHLSPSKLETTNTRLSVTAVVGISCSDPKAGWAILYPQQQLRSLQNLPIADHTRYITMSSNVSDSLF